MKKNDSLLHYFLKRKSLIKKSLIFSFLLSILFIGINSVEKPFIAKLYVEGVIDSESQFLDELNKIEENSNFKGLLVIINSPGGTFVSSKEIYDSLKFLNTKIPVAVYMKEVATSGAYLVSLGANKIFANTGTITGSVGVILQTAEITGLLDKLGIAPVIIKSGELKAIPNPFEESDREQIDFIKEVVSEMQKEFIGLVKLEREISPEKIKIVSDGRIFTSRQAQKINLIDEIAAEKDAINWIKKKGGLDDNIKIIDYADKKDLGKVLDLKIFNKLKSFDNTLIKGILALWVP